MPLARFRIGRKHRFERLRGGGRTAPFAPAGRTFGPPEQFTVFIPVGSRYPNVTDHAPLLNAEKLPNDSIRVANIVIE